MTLNSETMTGATEAAIRRLEERTRVVGGLVQSLTDAAKPDSVQLRLALNDGWRHRALLFHCTPDAERRVMADVRRIESGIVERGFELERLAADRDAFDAFDDELLAAASGYLCAMIGVLEWLQAVQSERLDRLLLWLARAVFEHQGESVAA